jgi:hypothetical protein
MKFTVERWLGHWYVIKDGNLIIKRPNSITDTFKTKKEAQAFAQQLQTKAETGRLNFPSTGKASADEAL